MELIDRDRTAQPMLSTLLKAYGVTIRIDADDDKIFEHVKRICRKAFVDRLEFLSSGGTVPDLHYKFLTQPDGEVSYDLDGALDGIFFRDGLSDRHLNSMIRAHVAGKTKDWVFVHAGVVVWRGKAIIIPGNSHYGKTTLVAELIKLGAKYMSDEFAVLDPAGLVHPFDRDLAVRTSVEAGMESISPAVFGAEKWLEPVEAGMVLFTKFDENGSWYPERMTLGNGILASVPQVIPFSFNTEFVLKVLNTTFNRAIIVKSDRGEARETAPKILDYFDESLMVGAEEPV